MPIPNIPIRKLVITSETRIVTTSYNLHIQKGIYMQTWKVYLQMHLPQKLQLVSHELEHIRETMLTVHNNESVNEGKVPSQ